MTEQHIGPHNEKARREQAAAGAGGDGGQGAPGAVERGAAKQGSSSWPNGAPTTAAGTAAPSASGGGQAVVGTFTLRDLVALGAVLVMFIGSLLPIFRAGYLLNLWTGASLFFIGIGIVLPLIVAGLFLGRRLAPKSTFRVGSLSVDQFGSVVASFATAYFFLSIVGSFGFGFLIALIGSLGLLAATVAAPWLPFFAADFAGRPESAAHPVARDAILPVQKPAAAPKPPVQAHTRPQVTGPNPAGSNAEGPQAAGSNAAGSNAVGAAAAGSNDAATTSGSRPAPESARSGAASSSSSSVAVTGTASPSGSGTEGASGSRSSADPARESASSSSPQPMPIAPELSQFVGGAAAGGGVVAAAQSLPAEKQTASGSRAGGTERPVPTDGSGHTSADGSGKAAAEGSGHAPTEAGGRNSGAGSLSSRASEGLGAAVNHAGTGAAAASSAVEPVDESLPGVPPTTVNPTVQPRRESIGAIVDPASRSEAGPSSHGQHGNGHGDEAGDGSADDASYDAFWFAVDRPRPVVDEKTGGFLYNVDPGNWILALQDRGQDFLVQNTDGRVGVLRDLRDIERAPEGE